MTLHVLNDLVQGRMARVRRVRRPRRRGRCPVTRLPYRFANGGPTTPDGIPVVHAPRLALNPPWALMVVRSVDGHAVAYTADPDFEWAHYVAECRAQARRIVRDGLRRRLTWLRGA